MNIIDNSLENARKLNIFELWLFELYLLSVAFVISIIFPVFLDISIFVYFAVFAICFIFFITKLFSKNSNIKERIASKGMHIHVLKNFWIFWMSAYKIMMVSLGFILVLLFPVLLSLNLAWYTGVAWVGAGYFMGLFFKK